MSSDSEVPWVFYHRLEAKNTRCWEREQKFFGPVHNLAPSEWKPGGDFAKPFENWELPER